MRQRPYKVIAWGPGYLGSAVIKELLKRPEFELVGVLAYNESKNGMDIGEMLGIDPVGVKITTDQDEIMAMDADCVVHTGTNLLDPSPRHIEVTRLLESGKNVVSAPYYHYPPLKGQTFVDMLNDACQKGDSSLYGTGIHPGVLCERLAILLTSFSNEIEYIRAQEYFNLTNVESKLMLRACTFGMTLEKANSIIHKIEDGAGDPYYYPAVAQACHILGHDVERDADLLYGLHRWLAAPALSIRFLAVTANIVPWASGRVWTWLGGFSLEFDGPRKSALATVTQKDLQLVFDLGLRGSLLRGFESDGDVEI